MTIDITDCRALIAEIDVTAAMLAQCYGELSPAAKARAIELAHSLSAIRRKFSDQTEVPFWIAAMEV